MGSSWDQRSWRRLVAWTSLLAVR
ncbi:hydroxylase3 [Zea mays]|uniref:Hydroxylase3 n=1 Tax=Zea mays TaxID=4577 RepID=A0A1D6JC05_MAIZE|nr:hydroxylase3 [Zea mays]